MAISRSARSHAIEYSARELETEVIEDEVLSKNMVFESEGKDLALGSEFSCDRVESVGERRYEVTSEDGLEVVLFELDEARDALRPLEWRLDTTGRFLFKKFVMERRVQYLALE